MIGTSVNALPFITCMMNGKCISKECSACKNMTARVNGITLHIQLFNIFCMRTSSTFCDAKANCFVLNSSSLTFLSTVALPKGLSKVVRLESRHSRV